MNQEIFEDRVELNGLVMLQAKQGYMGRASRQLKDGIARIARGEVIMPAFAATPDTAAQSSTATEEDQAIHNRCTYNQFFTEKANGEPTPAPTPIPAPAPSPPAPRRRWGEVLVVLCMLVVLAVLLGLGSLWWLYINRSQPTPAPPRPAGSSQEYLDLR